ncbi:hypothetical protein [Desulfotruncus arcticus]|uniref:hypothetical protein n=1 Tax=Desulfotruncus arcticus TaxID=341036 RepID=UPI000B85F33E|nr:hypothetical protein [Desulfotruncus arcticus]
MSILTLFKNYVHYNCNTHLIKSLIHIVIAIIFLKKEELCIKKKKLVLILAIAILTISISGIASAATLGTLSYWYSDASSGMQLPPFMPIVEIIYAYFDIVQLY